MAIPEYRIFAIKFVDFERVCIKGILFMNEGVEIDRSAFAVLFALRLVALPIGS